MLKKEFEKLFENIENTWKNIFKKYGKDEKIGTDYKGFDKENHMTKHNDIKNP